MGDSDEEYDRRRARDKFRRERSDYQERRDDRGRRDDWSERDRGNRRDYRDYDIRNRRDRYSPVRHEISPPIKRMRRDWEDRGGYGGSYDPGFPGGALIGGPPTGWAMHQPQQQPREVDTGLTQPPMMTFKQFLASQDDGIDDQEAVKKYNEYKLEFKRQQINEFFLNHKDEEWFRLKYHPEDSTRRQTELATALKTRLDVFMEFFEKVLVDEVKVDVENSEKIIKFLDSVVIKLEGGTDFDLKVLDETFEDIKKETIPLPILDKKEPTENNQKEPGAEPASDGKKKKRKTSHGSDFDDSSVSDSDLEEDDDAADENGEKPSSESGELKKKKKVRRDSDSVSEKDENTSEKMVIAEPEKEEENSNRSDMAEKEEKEEQPAQEIKEEEDTVEKDNSDKEDGEEVEETEKIPSEGTEEPKDEEMPTSEVKEEEPKPRALHKTCSIFLRYLAPSITKQEVEAMCKRFPGFLRVAIAEPQSERRFVRRAWVTFERSVNIKEVCWNLNGIRLRDSELGAIVNRDLSRRIRSVNGISSHKQVVRADIKLAARIIQNLDKQKKLWYDEDQKAEAPQQGFMLVSKNPLLKNITDYLIEEASAEEEELLGTADKDENKDEEGFTLERDEVLIQVLDRMLLYLRVVHSVDYYNSSEYPSEDEMPNRCGIMHARGSPPSSKVTQQEIGDYIANFEQKSQVFLQTPTKLVDEDAVKLGKKDPAVETEKFIQANTQELSKDKWLCPLSGKKFKGPEFVRKHIFNKHGEKVEEVKKEVEYFNNYLMDSKRPQLPEHPSSRPQSGQRDMHSSNMGHPFHSGLYPPPPPPYGFGPRVHGPNFGGFGNQGYVRGPDMYRTGGFKRSFQRRSPRDQRKIMSYRDLDAPNDMDIF